MATPQSEPFPSSTIGGPFKFQSGPFTGRIVRSALQELQKADRGRKYARKDKRPLDPPPVVRMFCFQTVHAGTSAEVEQEYENFDEHSTFGFVCHVDLIPIRPDTTSSSDPRETGTQISLPSADYIDRYGDSCTSLLFGETFVPCSLVEHEGRHAALFVFSDLAVRQEGRFVLRYRVFNIRGEERYIPILAECYGGSFEIFSTKTFPGLRASTDLTKTLSLNGIRVNSRYRERKVRKRPRQTTESFTSESPEAGSSTARASASKSPKQVILPSTQGRGTSSQPRSVFGSDAQASQAALDAWHEKEAREEQMSSRSTSRSFSMDGS
ncbi:hypothetical protein OH76DRAFT_1398471 [Lentinus brumalis]|uniref:Velvet domain-containing protein n=1 Tax=Lentinus brumalis TaxID=2498619 RepID=A0A371DNM9_9APHY|nr:hypothetical protein OH76DRAFT_1398471 [Polyporus brumalis]